MVDLYSKPSISGYNNNPPSDDGSNTAANEITWSKHKTKLTDPIKTLVDSMNTNIDTLADSLFGKAVTSISSNTNLATSDYGKLIVSTGTTTLTLLDGADAGSNFVFVVRNNDSSLDLTIGRNGNNINGVAADDTISPNKSAIYFCDGTNWFSMDAGATFLDEDDMASDSATQGATQQSIKAYVDNEISNVITLGTPQATTSGTAKSFTSIPSGTKRITISFAGVSTDGTEELMVQIGDSGGLETSGYSGYAVQNDNQFDAMSASFLITQSLSAIAAYNTYAVLTLVDSSTNTWNFFAATTVNGGFWNATGSKSLSAELDRLTISTDGTPV